ncbi:protein 4.1 isoform X2 [Pleurodeles waltl]|uniref:protein 4.1 isoform X2 n=1 Tax=Pleurodeles waltl TaxID=8319 RepID=UPI00370951FD
MTTEKSVVADAENPPQQQKREEEKQEETTGAKVPEVPPDEEPRKGDGEPKLRKKKLAGSVSNKEDTPAHEDQNRSKDRHSEGKGLSRLFSSFLKRPKSQVVEEKDSQPTKNLDKDEKKDNVEEEILLKAPIAAPEPELRTDPSLDLHSLSSAETQPAQEDREDNQYFDQDFEAKEDKEAADDCAKGDNTETKTGIETKPTQKSVKKSKGMRCKVTLLDDTLFECDVEKHAKGQDLMKKVCDHLNLMEEDYFGLAIWESESTKVWLDAAKEIKKQIHGPWNFTFNVKFYPPDPAQLTEDITRYNLCLQLRQDIVSGRLPCSFATLALLGSYSVQSELGDYDPDLHGTDYISEFKLSPNQTKELEEKVIELHKSYRSMTPAQADLEFLENAKKLSMYGVDLHQAKDLEGVDIILGVCSSGLLVYKDKLRINRFPWPKVLKISYKRSSFFIKIRPGEQEQYESTIGFKLPSYKAAKKLWKVCVEHHTFFRLTSTEAIPKGRFLALGSKFRYSGRTQAQTRHASAMIDRPAPQFERTASKRASRSLDGAKHVPYKVEFRDLEDDGVETMVLEGPRLDQEPEHLAMVDFSSINVASIEEEEEEEEEAVVVDKVLAMDVPEPKSVHVEPASKEPAVSAFANIDVSPIEEEEEQLLLMNEPKSISVFVEPAPKESAAVVVTPARNLRPISAPAIAQRHVMDPSHSISIDANDILVSRVVKEAVEVKEEEKPSERIDPELKDEKVGKEQTETQVATTNGDQVQKPTEREDDLIRMRKDLDKTQDEIMKHHASISELKKSFMESVPAQRPSEWDKRLSTHSPFRALNVNGQVQTGVDGPPLVKTQTVTISDVSNVVKSEIPTKEVPLVHTETKTITYEAAQTDDSHCDLDPGVLLTAHTITSETTSSTTTTQITKTVKGGISETRIEKRIVITGDSDIDHDQVLVQAIKEAKEQHPDMSVTKVVVHQETEIAEE